MPCLEISPIDGGESRIQRDQRPEHRCRQCHKNNEGIAETLILGREHQEDHDEREHEGVDQRVAFLDELPALALEIIGEALREALGLGLEKIDRLTHGPSRERHAPPRKPTERT